MASLIKNQIIKRLSKFVKNLSSNQINVSTFKGEGELSSINLDEKAIEDVIELPTWLKIQKATCGRAFIKIPWTNLKNLPIQIQLDDVTIEIETCEKLRDLNSNISNGNDPLIGKYGFTNRVIDGISLTITNLTFAIKAQAFKASIFLPSLDIYSTTPNGKRIETLTFTRLRNMAKTHILLFKEISWENVRIEASSNDNSLPGTAIRFIINSCRIRISMKKNLHDSAMVSSCVMIFFDDILSVVNEAQLKSALNTYKEIIQLMKQASEQRKQIAGNKLIRLERQPQPKVYQSELKNLNNSSPSQQQSNDPFDRYDIIETSLHFNVKRLDLHIIADSDVLTDRVVENGAIQITIANLSIDHYPYHVYGLSKEHWSKSGEIQFVNRNKWVNKLHEEWNEQLNIAKSSVLNDERSKNFEKALRSNHIRLFESCSILNIDDFVIYPVSISKDSHQQRRRPLITSDKIYYQLPDALGIINIQYTEYYYPSPYSFPVPNNDLYIQIMPIIFRIDFATLSWLDAFISTLSITIDNSGVLQTEKSNIDIEHVSVKLEVMLPRILITSDLFSTKINDTQPHEILELNISEILITNTRIESTSNRNLLEKHLELFKKTNFFQQTQWPFSNTTTTKRISSLFEKHPYDTYLYNNPLSKKTTSLQEAQSTDRALHTYYTMTTDSLKKSAKYDIWHFNAKSIYLDFTSSNLNQAVKQNMIDTLALTGWAVFDEKDNNSWLNILCILENSAIIKISQKQYTFIMHLADELTLFLDILERNKIQTRLIKQNSLFKNPTNDPQITICLSSPNTITLAVIDGLDNTINNHSSSLPETETESSLPDISNMNIVSDLVTAPISIITSTTKTESSSLNKNNNLSGQKKSKLEGNTQRRLGSFSKRSSVSSFMNMSDFSDDVSVQWDLGDDLDADLNASVFNYDIEQQPQHQVARIEHDDCISLTEKNYIETMPLEYINGVFIKINDINVCITEDNEKPDKPMYIACNAKYLRIDEFSSLKFDSITPKLFENQSPDELNNENVPPITIRIDFLKNELPSPPIVTLQVQDRLLKMTSHAIDILSQNLEEIFTIEEKLIKLNQPIQVAPIDVHLNNVELTLELPNEHSTTQAIVDIKPPVKVIIEWIHILRQIDGRVIIQKPKDNKQNIPSLSNENLQQLELLRIENERLRSELNTRKMEISVLRDERDNLMNTIAKLDNDLIQAESPRIFQQPFRKK